jgi:hypothetical protein
MGFRDRAREISARGQDQLARSQVALNLPPPVSEVTESFAWPEPFTMVILVGP